MQVLRTETLGLRTPQQLLQVRQLVRQWSTELKFSLVDQTKVVTATSELARNTLNYGKGGDVRVEVVEAPGGRQGLRLTFEDRGPGIPDVEQALKDGYTTGTGMGLGLGGARRLSHEFEIWSRPGEGTRVTILRWR